MGLGHTHDCTTFTRLPQPPGVIRQVMVGILHTLVLTDQGLYAYGYNRYGQLGLGHTNECIMTFTRLPQQPPGVILQVAFGTHHTLVLTDQGLYACGFNVYGQLGLGHTNDCTTFTRLPQQPPGVLQVMAVDSCTLVLTDQGLYACGSGGYAQLGLGYKNDCTTLTRLPQQSPGIILQVAFGTHHTLVLTDQGLYACGNNTSGQLGLGHANRCTTFTRLEQQPPGVILQVMVDGSCTLALTDQGLYACGYNRQGQLGLGHTNDCTTLTRLPQQPPGIILQVAFGNDHTMVLTDQGLYVCGNNRQGQLGLGHTNACMTLTAVDQVPSELRQLQALYHQLNTLIRLSQTESPLHSLER